MIEEKTKDISSNNFALTARVHAQNFDIIICMYYDILIYCLTILNYPISKTYENRARRKCSFI